MLVLVDTSVWINYFKGRETVLDALIENDSLVTNPVILAELLPAIRLRKEFDLAELLQRVRCLPMSIEWSELMQMQLTCLRSGANGIGLPDLMIAQNALQQDCRVYSADKHFRLMQEALALPAYPSGLH